MPTIEAQTPPGYESPFSDPKFYHCLHEHLAALCKIPGILGCLMLRADDGEYVLFDIHQSVKNLQEDEGYKQEQANFGKEDPGIGSKLRIGMALEEHTLDKFFKAWPFPVHERRAMLFCLKKPFWDMEIEKNSKYIVYAYAR